jgi:hypothetical protein
LASCNTGMAARTVPLLLVQDAVSVADNEGWYRDAMKAAACTKANDGATPPIARSLDE